MVKKFTDEEYAAMLPKKQVGTAIILFNTKGELLMVKPDYRDGWLIPGGTTDEDESPLHCAIRETREEIGLDILDLKLVGVYYGHKKGVFTDSLKFVFYGGVLTDEQISKIVLQSEELTELRFSPPDQVISLFTLSLQRSLPASLLAIKNNTVAYIE